MNHYVPHRRAAHTGAPPFSLITDGLLARWKLDESSGLVANDSIGGFHANLLGTFDDNSWKAGPNGVGGSLEFAAGDCIAITAVHPELDLIGDQTLSVWFHPLGPSGNAGGWGGGVLCSYSNQFKRPYAITYEWSGRSRKFQCVGQLYSGPDTANEYAYGAWYHLCFVIASGIGYFYVDNVEDGVASVGTRTLGTNPVVMGQTLAELRDRDIHGMLSDARIYNRALNQTERDTIFAQQG